MPLADRMIIGFNDMVRRAMQRWQHMAELVKHCQIIKRRIAPLIIQIAQIGCACHRHKNRMTPAKLYILFRVAGVIGKFCRNGGN